MFEKVSSSFGKPQCSLCASCGLQNPFCWVAITAPSMTGLPFSVPCVARQGRRKTPTYRRWAQTVLFPIYHIIKTKRRNGVQVALTLWSYRCFFPPSAPINIWNDAPCRRATVILLIPGHILLLFFGGCRMTYFHLWGDNRWRWSRWPISSLCCFTDHSLPAACMAVHVSPLILGDAKLHGAWGNTIVCDKSCRKQPRKGAVGEGAAFKRGVCVGSKV